MALGSRHPHVAGSGAVVPSVAEPVVNDQLIFDRLLVMNGQCRYCFDTFDLSELLNSVR